MLVRCGRCRTELEVSGAGEFLCPRCGTRNVVRGPAAEGLYGPGGVTLGGGSPAAPPSDAAVRWIDCPSCSYRFVAGSEAGEVICPNCRTKLTLDASGATPETPSG